MMGLLNLFYIRVPQIIKSPNFPTSFFEDYSSDDIEKYWIPTSQNNYSVSWSVEETYPPVSYPNEKALVIKSRQGLGAISSKFPHPISFTNKTFVLQYEIRSEIGLSCTGTYIKLFSDSHFNEDLLTEQTPYSIMFGPDKCGDFKKIQFIWKYFHPKRKQYIEKVLKENLTFPVDEFNHLYTLVIRPNNTYSIYVDNSLTKNGSLFFDFSPPLEKREIIDPNAKMPLDWDSSKNGQWKPPKIRNPYYVVDFDMYDLDPVTAVGFEIQVNNRNIAFMNILIAHDERAVLEWNKKNFLVRQKWQIDSFNEQFSRKTQSQIREDLNELKSQKRSKFIGTFSVIIFSILFFVFFKFVM